MNKNIKLFASLLFVFLIAQHSYATGSSENSKTIFTDNVANITSTSANLNGHYDNGSVAYPDSVSGQSYYFQYKKKSSLSWLKTDAQLRTGIVQNEKISTTIKGLKPNTIYSYRFVQALVYSRSVKNGFKVYGDTLTFKTAKK